MQTRVLPDRTVLLSGGIDSACLLALYAEQEQNDVEALYEVLQGVAGDDDPRDLLLGDQSVEVRLGGGVSCRSRHQARRYQDGVATGGGESADYDLLRGRSAL